MKINHLYRLIVILLLFAFVLPGDTFAEGGTVDEIQRPAPAVPVQLGPDFQVMPDPSAEAAAHEAVPSATDISVPMGTTPPEGGVEAQYSPAPAGSKGARDTAGSSESTPNGPNACTNLLQNADFESNSSWTLSPTTNVKYSQYSNGSGRALYMTTKNRQIAWLGQTITVPSGAGSIHLSFDAYQNMDPNDPGAWVSIYNGTQHWWSGQIRGPKQAWSRLYWPLSQASFSGQRITVWFQMHPNNDDFFSDMWLDNVKFELCDAPPTTPARTGAIDLKVSIYRTTVSTADRAKYEEIFEHAADAVYEMTNGKHYLRNVTMYLGWGNYASAHIRWFDCVWPNARLGGYFEPSLERLYFGDLWPNLAKFHPGPPNSGECTSVRMNHLVSRQNAGYTLAHELGHFYYALSDEYENSDYPNDKHVEFSVMSETWCAAPNTDPLTCRAPEYALNWLNFSTPVNFTPNNDQGRLYKASAWETLGRSPWTDPSGTILWLKARPIRRHFTDLASAAPIAGQYPKLDLPAAHAEASALLQPLTWIPTSSNAIEERGYAASVRSEIQNSESTVTYPEPLLLTARLGGDFPIARAALTTQVTAPDGSTGALTLRDDGAAPDYLPDDGTFTAILPYKQNGAYKIKVTFSNAANRAAFTSVGLEDVPWVVGDPIGESFSVTADTTVVTSGYTGDDHPDGFPDPTILFSDNVPKRGQVDRVGDRDMFKSTLSGDGTFVLRLSSFALGMQPRLRLWQSDGTTLIGDWTIVPEEGYYYFIRLTGSMDASFYAEISHANTQAAQGMYALSFGRPLDGEEPAEQYKVFLPFTVR